MALPPKCTIAVSNEILVRVDDFSKIIASTLFFSEAVLLAGFLLSSAAREIRPRSSLGVRSISVMK
jgi:hypothetical protein